MVWFSRKEVQAEWGLGPSGKPGAAPDPSQKCVPGSVEGAWWAGRGERQLGSWGRGLNISLLQVTER